MEIKTISEIVTLLTKDSAVDVHTCIENAKSKVPNFISKSGIISKMHEVGRKNFSHSSTMIGSLKNTELLTDSWTENNNDLSKEVFFGEHIREAFNTIKAFLKK